MPAIRLEEQVHIAKPVQDVFAAWSTAESLADWFAPMAIARPAVELDFREGGEYSIRMPLPDDQVFTTSGVFMEIDTDAKIVMTWRCDAFPDPKTLVTVHFEADREGTIVRVIHENFTNDSTCNNHKHGWELCLGKLKMTLEESSREAK
jgi:uncharacterized protein YndB with AHSA1/START domain